MTRGVAITGGPGGRIGPLFSQQFRLPILERKEKFVLRRLGFGRVRGYQAAYRVLSRLRPFESDRSERIVAAGWHSKGRVREEEEEKWTRKGRELHGREINNLRLFNKRDKKSSRGVASTRGGGSWSGTINPIVWLTITIFPCGPILAETNVYISR